LLADTKKILILLSLFPLILSIGIAPALPFVDAKTMLPDWIQNNAKWYGEGKISEDDYIAGLQWLIKEGIIQVPNNQLIKEVIEPFSFQNPGTEQPNIIVIMPDDVGWYNIGAYNDGIMSGITPNINKIAEQGMRFTDYYADPSCTAGRASLITGELLYLQI